MDGNKTYDLVNASCVMLGKGKDAKMFALAPSTLIGGLETWGDSRWMSIVTYSHTY